MLPPQLLLSSCVSDSPGEKLQRPLELINGHLIAIDGNTNPIIAHYMAIHTRQFLWVRRVFPSVEGEEDNRKLPRITSGAPLNGHELAIEFTFHGFNGLL